MEEILEEQNRPHEGRVDQPQEAQPQEPEQQEVQVTVTDATTGEQLSDYRDTVTDESYIFDSALGRYRQVTMSKDKVTGITTILDISQALAPGQDGAPRNPSSNTPGSVPSEVFHDAAEYEVSEEPKNATEGPLADVDLRAPPGLDPQLSENPERANPTTGTTPRGEPSGPTGIGLALTMVSPPPPPDVPDGEDDLYSEVDRSRPFNTVKDRVRHLEENLTPRGTSGSEHPIAPNVPTFPISTPTGTGNTTPNVEQPRKEKDPLELIHQLETRMNVMHVEHKEHLRRIEEERNAERKRFAEELKAIKYTEEYKKNVALDQMSYEMNEAIRLLAVAKSEGHLDLPTAAQTLRECDQQLSDPSSSSSGVEQAAREEAIAVRTATATEDCADLGFEFITGDEH